MMRLSDFLRRVEDPEKRAAYRARAAEKLATAPGARRITSRKKGEPPPSAELTAPLTFAMPLPPTITNSASGRSRNPHALESEKKRYWRACDEWRGEGRIPPKPPLPYRRAWLRVTLYVGGAMDDDNATARAKWALDWLVKHRYLLSDRRTCLRWTGMPDQVVSRSHEYRLVLTLSPRSDEAVPSR
jgi:hypothetical protein